MNRLAPLIVRRAGRHASLGAPRLIEMPTAAQARSMLEDLRLFATGWLGGLIFFGTFFG
jgi:hypothetical protein